LAKRLIQDNAENGDVNRDEVSRALLQYLNTPLRGLTESPAQIVFGRRVKCSLPSLPQHAVWRAQRDAREVGMAKLKVENLAKLNARPHKTLTPLNVGQTVNVQNQTGPKPLRWERTGVIVETLPHRQYQIRMDGSGRVTLRNRKFLKPTTPLHVAQLSPARSAWPQRLPNETLPDLPTIDREEAGEEAEAARADQRVPVPAPVRVQVQIPETPEMMEDIT